MTLLCITLLLICGYLYMRLRATGRITRQLIEAAERTEPLLLEENNALIQAFRLDQLVKAFNKLVAENARFSGSGQEQYDQIQTLLGNLREAVVMVDRDDVILSANRAFNELTQANDSPKGQRLDTYLTGPDFIEFLNRLRLDRQPRHDELEVEISQEPYWLEASAAPLKETQGEDGNYTLFVFQNITRQKKLEMMRTEFVANVSHELKTPVTVIRGFAQTLMEDDADLSAEERLRFLQKIISNSERLHSLLQDLLLLSRLESTEMILKREDLSLAEFLRDLAENWKATLADQCELVLDLEDGPDIVHADPLRLSQVITNLMENALRHGAGLSRLTIRTRIGPQTIQLEVEDDGAGIPERDLPHIFQRFYRVDKGRSRESGGTGLGLSIVKHIVGQHGGDITAWSRKGEGTRISITLPTADRARLAGLNVRK
ncbi:MAG: sensor histidine kinase [Puniceicoccaceae bacterium]